MLANKPMSKSQYRTLHAEDHLNGVKRKTKYMKCQIQTAAFNFSILDIMNK